MAATRQDIEGWFDRGVAQKARHMIVVCDSFDYDDYPVFTTTDDECLHFNAIYIFLNFDC